MIIDSCICSWHALSQILKSFFEIRPLEFNRGTPAPAAAAAATPAATTSSHAEAAHAPAADAPHASKPRPGGLTKVVPVDEDANKAAAAVRAEVERQVLLFDFLKLLIIALKGVKGIDTFSWEMQRGYSLV